MQDDLEFIPRSIYGSSERFFIKMIILKFIFFVSITRINKSFINYSQISARI